MRISCVLFGLALVAAIAVASPVVKREAENEDLSPLNEEKIVSTTENIPEFDRKRVSLDVPSTAFGSGFTLVTNFSKILNSLILNSARRTQTVLELFKPVFRGVFAIKGLPSDNAH